MGFSSFGQTYFIGLFAADMQAQFNLSHSDLGGIFSAITLASAFMMMCTGRFIDRLPLIIFTVLVLAGLIAGAFLLSSTQTVVSFIIALFLLRHCGQGLCAHISITAMARSYDTNRGVATSIVSTGLAVTEGLFPLLAGVLLAIFSWQQNWLYFALALACLGLPMAAILARFEPTYKLDSVKTEAPPPDFTASSMLKDYRFYFYLPLYIAPAFLLTGTFFHHHAMLADYHWQIADLALAFSAFAICKIAAGLITGPLIDRFSARKLFLFTRLPLLISFAVLLLPNIFGVSALYLYLAFAGIAVGVNVPTSGSLWAELYGVRHLGSIRSITSSVMIFSTALAPALFGFILDFGFHFKALVYAMLAYIILASLLACSQSPR